MKRAFESFYSTAYCRYIPVSRITCSLKMSHEPRSLKGATFLGESQRVSFYVVISKLFTSSSLSVYAFDIREGQKLYSYFFGHFYTRASSVGGTLGAVVIPSLCFSVTAIGTGFNTHFWISPACCWRYMKKIIGAVKTNHIYCYDLTWWRILARIELLKMKKKN